MSLERDWQRFKDERGRYVQAAEDTRELLLRIAKDHHTPADVSARAKDTGEFVRKALRKGYTDPWTQTTDKAGARAAVEREAHVDRLLDAILSDGSLPLVPDTIEDKRSRQPGTLEYGGVHLRVLAPAREGDDHEHEVEVQLRTKAQDLWSSVVSHRLLYKKAVELPVSVQHRLYNLLALMELFDQEVTRVVRDLPTYEGYVQDKLATAGEAAYLHAQPAVHWDKALSASLLAAVEAAIEGEDVEDYVDEVAAFARDHSDDLSALLADYASDAADGDPNYVLFSQPEVVLLWERLEHAPERLRAAWDRSRLPYELLTRTADVLGLPYADD